MCNPIYKHLARLALVVILLLLVVTPTPAQGADEYSLTWFVVGGGSYTMSSADGSFAMSATAGQPATGTLSGGGYSVQAGFWAGATDDTSVHLPLIMR